MKKFLSCLLAVLLIASIGVFAYADELVKSPAAGVQVFQPATGNGQIVIVPSAEKDQLPEDLLEAFEEAYKALEDAEDLSELFPDVTIPDGKKLAVYDAYEMYAVGEVEFPVDIAFECENLGDFAGLGHYVDGEWTLVDGAEANSEDDVDSVAFTAEDLGSFAVLVLADA